MPKITIEIERDDLQRVSKNLGRMFKGKRGKAFLEALAFALTETKVFDRDDFVNKPGKGASKKPKKEARPKATKIDPKAKRL
jgi:uracil-DNA glycosylase